MTPEMQRLKQLDDENTKLRKVVADLSLDREMLQDSGVGPGSWLQNEEVVRLDVQTRLDLSEKDLLFAAFSVGIKEQLARLGGVNDMVALVVGLRPLLEGLRVELAGGECVED